MASMGCIVALPDKALFQGEITYANIPGTDGYFGVLPGHELTVSLNREGGLVTLTIDDNEKREFLVMGGATSVLDDQDDGAGPFRYGRRGYRRRGRARRGRRVQECHRRAGAEERSPGSGDADDLAEEARVVRGPSLRT